MAELTPTNGHAKKSAAEKARASIAKSSIVEATAFDGDRVGDGKSLSVPAPSPRLPEIRVTNNRPAVVDEAEQALVCAGGVYVRARTIVVVVRDPGTSGWLTRPSGTPVIVSIEADNVTERLARSATWIRMGEGGPTQIPAPGWVAKTLLARGQWSLPQLEGVANAPVFRPDGSILDSPGYDVATRMMYDPCGVSFPKVPDRPTQADASRALAKLLDPFREFPFVGEADRSAVAAANLSVIARSAIDGPVPMFAVSATAPGSGKGLISDVTGIITAGRKPPLMAPTNDEDETRKRVHAIAIESPSFVVIDNVEGSIGSPSLAMALTTGEVRDRVLGSTRMLSASLRSVWMMTGNNVQLKGDLGRRVIPIDLDPKVEHPEDRVFERGDLVRYVSEHRGEFVVAALTVLRAFHLAGRPAHGLPAKGSYEAWDRLVRAAIIWAGGADPLGSVQRVRDRADEDLDRLRALLVSWKNTIGITPITIADAIKRAGESGALREALGAYCRTEKPDARQLGYALRKIRGRVVGHLRLDRGDADRDGTSCWQVTECG